jgi:hypothetical protein
MPTIAFDRSGVWSLDALLFYSGTNDLSKSTTITLKKRQGEIANFRLQLETHYQPPISERMRKIYKVTVSGLTPDVWVMVVEFPDDLASKYPESALENAAKAYSETAIIRRWQKMNPDASEVPKFVQSFSVELLPEFDTETVTPARVGPYRAESGVRVWMINGPFSFGLAAPPHLGFGGAW